MTQTAKFVGRCLVSTGLFVGALLLLRAARGRPDAPLIGSLAVAVLAGVMLEMLRWRRGVYGATVRRGHVLTFTGIGLAVWIFGLWIDAQSPDHGALVLGGSAAAALVVYAYELFPHFHHI